MAQYKEYGFEGRTAIVTGAGTGMGKSCAIELAKGGAKVALFGRRENVLQEVKEECLKYSPDVIAVSVDVADEEKVKAGVQKVLEAFNKIDILINCAGIENRLLPGESFWEHHFDNMSPDEYLKFFRTHALGHYLMNLAVVPNMIENHFGRVVNVTSVLGLNGVVDGPAYASSKAAAICQTKSFAQKYGKHNITFNSVAPGMVDTPMKIDATPEEFAFVANKTPLGRVADPIDIARVVLFFAQENLFATGQNIVVDGGSSGL